MAAMAWTLAVGTGLWGLHAYEATPGRPGDPRPCWPEGGRLRPVPGRPTLLLFAHPRCPCTRASLEELARIMERCQGAVTAHVVFFRPSVSPEPWRTTDLWTCAEAIPGVRVLDDPEGSEAARFGAETSGHVVLYDRSGELVYAGGITPARGRVGDNPGRDQVIRHLAGLPTIRAEAPVFGCSILGDRSASEGRNVDGR